MVKIVYYHIYKLFLYSRNLSNAQRATIHDKNTTKVIAKLHQGQNSKKKSTFYQIQHG